jgi:hypothetical protein
VTYVVLRWADGYEGPRLEDQLRARPGVKAVVEESQPSSVTGLVVQQLRARLGSDFEVHCEPVDDGPYGVLYDITATYAPQRPAPERQKD